MTIMIQDAFLCIYGYDDLEDALLCVADDNGIEDALLFSSYGD